MAKFITAELYINSANLVKFDTGQISKKFKKGGCAVRSGENTDSLNEQLQFLSGENWFFYWKISSSLWKSRLENDFADQKRLIVPINWSLHHIAKDRFDFAQERPETNLKRLVHLAEEYNKEVIFLLPLGPCPFIVNGGMPAHLAKSPSFHANLTPQKISLADGSFNQMYSFYDPRVFMEFAQFANLLGQYFSRSGVASSVFAAEYGFFNRHHFSSLFEDWSDAFEQAFFRFLKSKFPNDYEEQINEIEDNFMKREQKEKDFRHEIKRLYLGSMEEGVASNYEEALRIHLLHGQDERGFSFFPESSSFSKISEEMVECHRRGEIASSVLLDSKAKNGLLNDLYKSLIANEVYPNKFEAQMITDGTALSFQSLTHFEVYDYFQSQVYKPLVYQNGLINHLNTEFGTSYSLESITDFIPPDEEAEPIFNPVKYFSSPYLDEKRFSDILRLFMDGNNIILDRSGMDPDLLKRLELFLLENNLNVEKVNFHIEVHHIELGQGRLTLFKSHDLVELEAIKREQFWSKLMQTFDIRYLKIDQKEPLLTIWRTRPANASELSYEEVRRLTLVNTTSYRKKLEIELKKNFALKKVANEDKANVEHRSNHVSIEVMPGGQVSLDIGVFS